MESFSRGISDKETKGKSEILDDKEPPYFDMEATPKIPFYKAKIFIILVSILSIILIGIVAFVLIFKNFPNGVSKYENAMENRVINNDSFIDKNDQVSFSSGNEEFLLYYEFDPNHISFLENIRFSVSIEDGSGNKNR